MKLNKQTLLLVGIVLIGLGAYSLIPNFEREEFNSEVIEDISSGIITTTTLGQNNSNEIEENISEIPEKLSKTLKLLSNNQKVFPKNYEKSYICDQDFFYAIVRSR